MFGAAQGCGVVIAALAATLVGEMVWTVKRPLPAQAELDASGTIVGASEGCRRVRVVALGDSTLTGPGLGDSAQVWLRQALERLDHHCPIELVSLAAGGSRLADVARRVPDAVVLEPDLVVVAVGANDVLRGAPSRAVRVGLDRIVAGLLDVVDVVAVTNMGDLGNIARIPSPLSSVARARADTARSVIEDVVARHERAVLLDVTGADSVLRNRAAFTADLFHPDQVGHAAWAESVLPGLRRALERVERGGCVDPHHPKFGAQRALSATFAPNFG